MGNGGGPNILSGGRTRYIWRGKDWTVDAEKARWRIAWLTVSAVFMGFFSGLLFIVFAKYSGSWEDRWMLFASILLLLGFLVALFFINRIRSNPSVGVIYKRFSMRPSGLDALLRQACREGGVELVPTEPGRLRWDSKRDWDIHRSYDMKGMESKVNVVRRFRIRPNRVRIISFIEMGPKGHGEDEVLDQITRRIDAINLHHHEDVTVDFGEAEIRFKAWNALWIVSVILMNFLFLVYFGVFYGLIHDPTLVAFVEDYHLTLILMALALFVSIRSVNRIVDLSRKVTAS
jgi:hypothetical protein